MRKTALPTDDGPGKLTVVEDAVSATPAGPLLHRTEYRQGRQNLLRTGFVALMLVPSRATAEPLVTLPAPPFELPVVPPVSGTWTVMVGVGGAYNPDFEGPNRTMLSPVPLFSIPAAPS